jgi:hypothetical protein
MTLEETEALQRIAQGAEYLVLKKFLKEMAESVSSTRNIPVDGGSPELIACQVIGRNLVADILDNAVTSLDMLKKSGEKKEKQPDKYD